MCVLHVCVQRRLSFNFRDVLVHEYLRAVEGTAGDDGSDETADVSAASAPLPAGQALALLDVLWARPEHRTSLPSATTQRLVTALLATLTEPGVSDASSDVDSDYGGPSPSPVAGNELESSMSVLASVVRHVPGAARLVKASPRYQALQRTLIGLLAHTSASVVVYALLALSVLVAGDDVSAPVHVRHGAAVIVV